MDEGMAATELEIDDVSGISGAAVRGNPGGCGCGGDHGGAGSDAAHPDPQGALVVDVTAIPHAQRHATIFRLLAGTSAGEPLILVAPHDPLPLLAQLEDREPGAFSVRYEIRGPQRWRLRLTRRA